MKKTLFLLSIFSTLQSFTVKAQDFKRTYNWHFGDSLGLNFFTPSPSIINNSSLWSDEGCATISDTNGNLLFYTNGETVWNKSNQVMKNGDTLFGSHSSIQSSVIVPHPSNDSLFYLFTANVALNAGLRFHIINLKANNGNGEVVLKNQLLQPSVCEALAATHHKNNKYVWIISAGFKNKNFYAYLITDKGLISCPIVSVIGSVHGSVYLLDGEASLKFSNDGLKLANGLHDQNKTEIEIFDFDKEKGVLTNPVNISAHTTGITANPPYAMEFSPNKRYLYYSNWYNYLCRYDLSLGIGDSISAKRDTLYSPPGGDIFKQRLRGIQTTPQNRILIAVSDSSFLAGIDNPDSVNCGFTLKKINLGNKISKNGLPNFISSYFHHPRVSYSYQRDCISDSIRFWAKDTLNRNSWNWQFKKLADGSTSTSFIQNPVHRFVDTGNYEVRLIVGADTVTKTIHVSPPMQVDFNLGNDTSLCNGDSLLLQPGGSNHFCFQWQDFSTAPTYMAKQTGLYVVTATNQDFCQVQDSIHLTFTKIPKPTITRKADTLFATTGAYSYQWYKDSQPVSGGNQAFTVRSTDGSYQVKVTNAQGCSTFSDIYNTTGMSVLTQSPFQIYPNPVTHTLFIVPAQAGAENLSQVVLLNCIGEPVFEQAFPANNLSGQISCEGLPKGLYLLELTTNKKTYTVRIIIR